jgi:hypothetical protein
MHGDDREGETASAPARRRAWTILLALLVVTAWSYRGNSELGFTDADALADVAAARVERPSDLVRQVTQPLAAGVAGENANFWRPVTMLHYALLRGLFGWEPLGWQVWDLGLHLVAVWVVFLLVRAAGRPPGEALLAAGLVALHPLGVEVVPAVARSIDLLFTLFGLLALLAIAKQRLFLAALAGVLAIGAKETAVVILPIGVLWAFALGRRRDAAVLALVWGLALPLYLWGRSAVLAGWGGYRGEDPTFFLDRVGWSVGAGALELAFPGWTPQLEARLPSSTGLAAGIVALVLASLGAACAWRRKNRAAALGFALAFAPLLLYGVTGLYSRRLLYLPVAGLAIAVGALWQLRWLRWGIAAWLVSLAPASPLFHRDRDWLANDAVTRGLTDGLRAELGALPPDAVVWVLDRPIRLSRDPRRRMLWRKGWSVNNTAATYSLQAWVDDGLGRPDIELRFVDAVTDAERLDEAEVRTEERWIRVRRAPLDRVWGLRGDDSWTIDDAGSEVALRRSQASANEWLVVLGVPRARLVAVP